MRWSTSSCSLPRYWKLTEYPCCTAAPGSLRSLPQTWRIGNCRQSYAVIISFGQRMSVIPMIISSHLSFQRKKQTPTQNIYRLTHTWLQARERQSRWNRNVRMVQTAPNCFAWNRVSQHSPNTSCSLHTVMLFLFKYL